MVEFAILISDMTPATKPKTSLSPLARALEAKVKRISERQIGGYVLDPVDLDARFVVELLLDGFPARIARATLADPDLVVAGYGDGCYRFVFSLEQGVVSGARLAQVRLANSGEPLGSPIDLEEEAFEPDLVREGEARWIGGLCIEGWIPLRDGSSEGVRAIIDGETVASARADLWSHVGDAAAGGVARGFTLALPITLADGRLRRVRVVDATGRDLPGSPCAVVAFPMGLERFLEGRAEVASERERAGLFDRLIPQSLPFADFSAWARAFPPDPVLTSRRSRVGVALLGERNLDASLASLERQIDCDWVVGVLGEGGEPMSFRREDLESYLASDAADCEILAFAPAGVVFHPYALGRLVEALDAFSGAQLAYCDLEVTDDQGKEWPIALSAFDYERLLEQGYCAHVFVSRVAHVRVALAKGASDFYRLFNSALDAPGSLQANPPVHAPGFLARLPSEDFSRASSSLARATSQHLEARGLPAVVDARAADLFPRAHVIRTVAEGKTSIVIPTRDRLDLLRPCVESLLQTLAGADYELVVVDNDSTDERTHAYFDSIAARGVRIGHFSGPFNFSRIVDAGASIARGEYLLLLNNDVEATRPGWLKEMLSRIHERDVGAVGAQLLWPGGGIQHGGVVLGPNFAATHAFDERFDGDPGYGELLAVAHECSAVTAACLLTRRRLFNELGGFDSVRFPVLFNDVDFCLRLRERGLRVVFTPHAKLMHRTSASRGRDIAFTGRHRHQRDLDNLRTIWGDVLLDDPSYSPMLGLDGSPYTGLAWPPRSQAPRAPRIAPARRPPPGF